MYLGRTETRIASESDTSFYLQTRCDVDLKTKEAKTWRDINGKNRISGYEFTFKLKFVFSADDEAEQSKLRRLINSKRVVFTPRWGHTTNNQMDAYAGSIILGSDDQQDIVDELKVEIECDGIYEEIPW